MPYLSINDPQFERRITLGDAYRVLVAFVEQYNSRGESSTIDLLSDIGLLPNGSTGDPAQIEDFLNTASTIIPSN